MPVLALDLLPLPQLERENGRMFSVRDQVGIRPVTILQLAVTGLVLLQVWLYTKGELHRCPVCRDQGILDVERHCVVFHPGPFTPRYEDGAEFGIDPRPDETPLNVYPERLRRFIERSGR